MKKTLSSLVIVFLFFAIKVSGQVNLIAIPSTKTLNVGEKVTISIQAEAGTQEVGNAQIILNFNPTELQVNEASLTPGALLTQIPLNEVFFDESDSNKAQIRFSGSPNPGTSVNGTFDVLSFELEALTPNVLSQLSYEITDIIKSKISFFFNQDLLGTADPINISINSPPSINITAPSDGANIDRATDINFTATATDTEDEDSTLSIEWTSDGGTFDSTGTSVNGYFLDNGSRQVTATVTDSNGATHSQTLTVNVASPTLAINSPSPVSLLNSKSVTFELDPTGMDLTDDHFHFYINPADVNNLDPQERINTSGTNNTTFTYGEADNIQEGANTVVIIIANAIHAEFPSSQQAVSFTVDSTLPEIDLLGDNPMQLLVNTTYQEPGATANDSRDGDLTNALVIDATALDNTTLGDYQVSYSVTDEAGNTATVSRTVQVTATLGTAQTLVSNRIQLYPNPAHTTLYVQTGAKDELQALAIYSLDGRLIATQDQLGTTKDIAIDLSNYASGTYLLMATTKGERKIKRFVIQ